MTTAVPARRGRILLVEDDQEAAYFAVHVLTTMGRFDVTHTADPRVALEWARSEPWDLVLTDLDLPTMTGLDLLGALRRAVPGLPVAVITADAGPGPGANAARRQADAFLQKPVPAAQLVAVATALIGTLLLNFRSSAWLPHSHGAFNPAKHRRSSGHPRLGSVCVLPISPDSRLHARSLAGRRWRGLRGW
ncbi:MAG TPA: response regulator [Streptosporangiaceae bacterium]|jgi:CheY-like chemotaxis protein